MNSLDVLARLLRELRAGNPVSRSTISGRNYARLRPLLDAGVVREEPSGAGWRVVPVDQSGLQRFIDAKFPSGIDAVRMDLPPRAAAVAMYRDAKRAKAARAFPVVLRGFHGAVLTREDVVFDVAAQTRTSGAACLLVEPACTWAFQGSLAVVENLELFLHVEQVMPTVDLVLFAFGRLKATVKTWLASPSMAAARIIHFGDYDPTGLDEYRRLREVCGPRVEFFLPGNLEHLVEKYGEPSRLTKSARLLPTLSQCRDPAIERVLAVMQKYGRGLDHEALLIGVNDSAEDGRGTRLLPREGQ